MQEFGHSLIATEIFTGNHLAKPNWAAMSTRPQDFFPIRYLPDDETLKDPSKMQLNNVAKLWDYWYDKQRKGKDVFHFTGCDAKDRHNYVPEVAKRKYLLSGL